MLPPPYYHVWFNVMITNYPYIQLIIFLKIFASRLELCYICEKNTKYTMLIEFKVSNFRSVGGEQILSLVPTKNQKEYGDNIFHNGKYSSLNGLVMYGANGSGKSNIIRAMGVMTEIIRKSAGTSSTTKLPYDPFLLRDGFAGEDTKFEISFVVDDIRYRYGFCYNLVSITKEWLFRKATGRETKLFERQFDIIDVSSGIKGSSKLIDLAIEATRDNTLFLSTCDMLNIEEAKIIMSWISKLNIINGVHTQPLEIQTASLLKDPTYSDKIRTYLKSICLNIKDVVVQTKEFEDSDLPPEMSEDMKNAFIQQLRGKHQIKILAQHTIYDQDTLPTSRLMTWDWDERESSGSQKAMHMSGPILWTLATGGILVIDEMEAYLHPIMTLNTIEAFIDIRSNVNHAQLILATHDTNLLNNAKLRRDQIYFAEKNKWESTEIFSLSDFRYLGEKNGETISEAERPDADKEKRYIEGRYGAIPMLGQFNSFIRRVWQEKES